MTYKKETLLKLRSDLKKRKPSFRRVESWRYVRVKESWRKARGIDSKTRKKLKSGVKSPTVGYRAPKKVRGLHPSGFEEVRIYTKEEIDKLNPKKHAIKIARTVGARKRIKLIDYAQNKGFKILNLGISQKELEELESLAETDYSEYEAEMDEDEISLEDLDNITE
ncbi:MAG: 50S ribosomal protein L32e [Promethearchaeota archaeon]